MVKLFVRASQIFYSRRPLTTMQKQILILTTTSDFLYKFELDNVKILQNMGYTVHYAANMNEPHYLSSKGLFEKLGIHAHHIPIARSPYLFHDNKKALYQLIDLIRINNIHAVHCHTPVGGLLGRLCGELLGKEAPVILYTAHGFHFYKGAPMYNHLVYYPVEKLLARNTDILIVINQEDYQNALKLPLKKGGRVYRIPGVGLNGRLFHPISGKQRALCRQRLGISPEECFLISVGELNENKIHRVILQALAKMQASSPEPLPIRYGICGDGFFRERIQQWIVELGLENMVTLYGFRCDIPEMLGGADAAVFPSKREGLGMAGLEALAMGIPLLASDNRGTREYMENGKNGFLYAYDDVDGFIQGIQKICALSAPERRKMANFCIASAKPFDREHANAAMRQICADVSRRVEYKFRRIFSAQGQHPDGQLQPPQ